MGGGVRCSFAYAYQKLPARDEEDLLEGMDIDDVFRVAQSAHGE
jgi:hypothetical protein